MQSLMGEALSDWSVSELSPSIDLGDESTSASSLEVDMTERYDDLFLQQTI